MSNRRNRHNSTFGIYIVFLFISPIIFCPSLLAQPIPTPTPSLQLEVFATTMIQIVLKWEDTHPNTVSYVLQRDTNGSFASPTEYAINPGSAGFSLKIFSDTNREPGSKRQFTGHIGEGSLLDRNTLYYYRVKAVLDGGGEAISNTVTAQVSGPVRGVEGDLWADIVIGKPDFTQVQMGETTPYETQHTAGVLIDRTGAYDRMYIKDTSNNRILGFDGIPTRTSEPDVVIGQPDLYSSGANGDSGWQTYPYPVPASASSLCLVPPGLVSMTENWLISTMAVGENGSIFVIDEYNHRVLKYDDPFVNDTIADGVWGQANFMDNQANRGQSGPSANSLKFLAYGAVDVDCLGNLWVADFSNCRVLRFPKVNGVIQPNADLVFGQYNFTSAGAHGDSAGHTATYSPTGVRTVRQDNDDVWVYVSMLGCSLGPGRIVVFKPPFSNGMEGEVVNNEEMDPLSIKCDIDPQYLWVVKGGHYVLRMNLVTGEIDKRIYVGQPGLATPTEVDVDREGNLYVVTHEAGVYRYRPPDYEPMYSGERGPLGSAVFGIFNLVVSADSMNQCRGAAATFGDQLVAADHAGRVLIWNDYHNMVNGEAADDLYGKSDFSSITWIPTYAFPQTDAQGRLWVIKDSSNLLAFDPPLTNSSTPVKEFCIADWSLPVLGGGTISLAGISERSFAPAGSGDEIWVADQWNSRVFRIANIDGVKNPGQGHYVDIVLGQTDLAGTTCNQGLDHPTASSLCLPQHVMVDQNGNLYVSDSGDECSATNFRILEWDASSLPECPEAAVFAIPADRVIGTGGRFDISGYYCSDPACQPRKGGFSSNGIMVVPMNPYGPFGQRFPLVYLDPLNYQLPQMAMGDFLSYALEASFDSEGNLYIGDFDWSRVLIYKRPFKDIQIPTPIPTPTWDTRTPTYTPTITPTPTDTPTPTVTPTWDTRTPTYTPTYTPYPCENGIDSYCKLMLHCNGADGSTTFVDSATSKTVTASGDTQLDTYQQKFGTASCLFDGNDDHLALASHEDWHFGTGAFTVEFWFCLRGTRFIDIFYSHGGSNMPKGEGGAIGVSNYKIGYGSSGEGIVGTTTLATYTWYHCALVGDGGPDGARTIKLYLNGIQEGDTYVCDYDFVQTEIWLGANQHSTVVECLNGWIDEFRISKGIARWTGNFTPPICEYESPTPTPIGAAN